MSLENASFYFNYINASNKLNFKLISRKFEVLLIFFIRNKFFLIKDHKDYIDEAKNLKLKKNQLYS